MSIKILHFVDGLRTGGKERQLITLIKALKNNKDYDQTLVIMNKDIYFKEIYDLKIDIHFLIRTSRYDLSLFFKFYQLCKKFNPDIIHSWDTLTSIYTTPTAFFQRVKFINGSIRHSAPVVLLSKYWWITHLTYPFSHRVVSNSMAGLVANKKRENHKYRCIVNGFSSERVKKLKPEEEIREQFNIKTPYIVGMVANFEDRKDYLSFVKAAELILKKRDDVSFLAIGEGKNFSSISRMIKDKHLERILLPGQQRDVESIINIFDIGLLINNISGHGEGISNSIMEYMALGKPVIATDSGGSKELVINRETGFIIPPNSIAKLVNLILILLDDHKKKKSLGHSGKMRIEQEFSMEKMIDNYINLYDALL